MAVLASALSVAAAADLTGRWKGDVAYEDNGEQRKLPVRIDLKQDGSEVSGGVWSARGEYKFTGGKVDGEKLAFEVQTADGLVRFTLKLDAGTLSGPGTLVDTGMPLQASLKRDAEGELSGRWKGVAHWSANGDEGELDLSLDLKQDGAIVAGKISTESGSDPIKNGKFENGKLLFEVDPSDGPVTVELAVSGQELSGKALKVMTDGTRVNATLSLKREQ